MYAELINKTWARFKSEQERFMILSSLFPVLIFVLALDIAPVHWEAVRWIDLLFVLFIIILPTTASLFIAIRADKLYLSFKARELCESLIKYQKWEATSKKCDEQVKKEMIKLGLLKCHKKK